METRVLKRENKYYLELPDELGSDVEFFKLKDGFYLLSKRLGNVEVVKQKTGDVLLNHEEKTLVLKLLAFKFEDRVPPKIDKTLNDTERKTLSGLLSKKLITVYQNKKYPDGVYNITDNIFNFVKGQQTNGPLVKPVVQGERKSEMPGDFVLELKKKGYLILTDSNQAYAFSQKMKSEKSSILAVKGFDQKFYAATKTYYEKTSNAIKKALGEGDCDAVGIGKRCNLEADAVTVILRFLGEEGEVIEKKKGMFSLV
ncbi:MAG: hypothetical protein ABII22_02300 [Candidatus Micrarchaeota archaeon]